MTLAELLTDIHALEEQLLADQTPGAVYRIPAHPGEVLLEEFLKPLGLTQVEFARHIGVPTQRINEIVNGKRGITPETAWLFAQALDTTPEFWMNLQTNYDLTKKRPSRRVPSLQSVA